MGVTLYLITHVATAQQRERDAAGWGLSAEGQAQAETLAAAPFWPCVDHVVVSSEPKTALTVAGAVARHKLPVWVDSRLDELRRSGWVDNYGQKVAQVFSNPEIEVGGWESAQSALDRVRSAIGDVTWRFDGKVVAVVGHGLTLSLLRAHWLGYRRVRLNDWARLGFGSVAIVELPAGRFIHDFPLEASSRRG